MDELTPKDCSVSSFSDFYNMKEIVEQIVLSLIEGIFMESAGNSQNKQCLKGDESIYQIKNKPDDTKMDQIKPNYTEMNNTEDGTDKPADEVNSSIVKKINDEQFSNDEMPNSDEIKDHDSKLQTCPIDKKESVQFGSPIAVYYQYSVVSQSSSQDTEILSSDDDSEDSQTDAAKLVSGDANSGDSIDKKAIDKYICI